MRAIFVQYFLGVFYMFFGNFEQLIGFFGCSSWLFYFLTVFGMFHNNNSVVCVLTDYFEFLGLFRLRLVSPDLNRKYYRAPLYAPLCFCVISFTFVCMQMVENPTNTLISFLFIGLGVPVGAK